MFYRARFRSPTATQRNPASKKIGMWGFMWEQPDKKFKKGTAI